MSLFKVPKKAFELKPKALTLESSKKKTSH